METRRTFLKNIAGATIACCGVSLVSVLEGCTPARYVAHSTSNKGLRIKKADFLEDKYVLVNVDQLEAPIFLLKIAADSYKALLMLCTHKGCAVKPAGSVLVCPCHGSEFTHQGLLLTGPAT